MQEDDLFCLQSEGLGDTRPQSLHSVSSGHSELHGASGGGGDGQTHGRLAGAESSLAAWRPVQGEASGTSLLPPVLHLAERSDRGC